VLNARLLLMPDRPQRPVVSVEWIVLDLLLDDHHRGWSVGKLVDEIGSPVAVAEALDTLHAAGLIEHRDSFIRLAPL
jgi:hypothetical protein